MTIPKISLRASAVLVLLVSVLSAGALVQAQPVAPGYGVAGAPARDEHRPPLRPEAARPLPPPSGRPDGSPGYRPPPRPPMAFASPPPPPRYGYRRPPVVIVQPTIMVGSALPYNYQSYRIDNWGYYNLPDPCCGQYWVPYGQSFLLVGPDGVVLQVFTP